MDADSLAVTPGKRLYRIRLACGDGFREAETLKRFAARIKAETGVTYHANALSLLEHDAQGWKIGDAETLARVDPLKRGKVWLAFGITTNGTARAANPPTEVVENERDVPDPSTDGESDARGA